MAKKVSRRQFLKGAGAVGAGIVGGPLLQGLTRGPSVAWGAAKPIKFGGIYSLSGVVAAWGKAAQQGAMMAAMEINQAGGILKRPIEVKFEDDACNPEVGVRKTRRLVLEWGADFLHGFNHSGVALAAVPTLPELKRMLLIPCAAATQITTEAFNKYVFRPHANCYQSGAAGAVAAAKMPYKKWTVIGPDYSYGWDSWGGFIGNLVKRKPDVEVMSTQAWPKFAAGDYTSYIVKVLEAKPDAVYSSLWGGDFITFLKQAKRYGFFEKVGTVVTEAGLAMDAFYALSTKGGTESEIPEGLWTAAHGYWFEHPKTEKNKKWVDKFVSMYGEYPHIVAHDAYGIMYTYKKAIEKAKSIETDAVIAAMETMEFETPGYKRKFRKEDHSAFTDVPYGKTTKAPELTGIAMNLTELLDASIIEPIEDVLERRAKKTPAPWMKYVMKG
ncbi:MAG: ABC transporter substrate-binding protein [Thermodesulfobacteriota bacterium]|jgi:branched-chain amino acid transport system substrate-binding protein